MSSHGSDEDAAMLEATEALPDLSEQEQDNNLSASLQPLEAEQSAPNSTVAAAASKELRTEQQDRNEEDKEVTVEAVVAEDDDDEDDADAVMAAVVVDEGEDDDDVPLIQLSAPSKKPKKTTKTASSSKKSKGSKRKSPHVSNDRLEAASDARQMLIETVPRLPVLVSDTHVVRSFGRIHVESPGEESKWSSANALYPVGFSCDRYEFSPVHGRVLKMRCTIFDGKKLREKQIKNGISSNLPGDGPVFRIMWGQGIDEDVDIVDYPYDIYSESAPISHDKTVDTVAVPFGGKEMLQELEPEAGMRVRVRFERNAWHSGTVVSVGNEERGKKKKRKMYDIRIHYDDGFVEDIIFPDPDISIFLPGAEDGSTENGVVQIDELRGKPVTSVVGTSPVRAWGNALIKLGLIDEVTLESALDALAVARAEGREEAKEKLQGKKMQRQQARARMQQKQQSSAPAGESGDDSRGKQGSVTSKKAQESDEPVENEDYEGPLKTPLRSPTNEGALVNENGQHDKAADDETDEKKGVALATDGKHISPLPSCDLDRNEDGNNNVPSDSSPGKEESNANEEEEKEKDVEEADPPSEAEIELHRKIEQLQRDLIDRQAEDRESSIALADGRISTLGPFFINPFHERGPSLTQQSQWLSTVVRKEKTKMGSTGNKRKIVTATDLLERNDTFVNDDMQSLVEGLPGTEYCHSYVFQAFRAGGASAVSQAWVHEAKLRQERDRERHARSVSKAKADASELREKERKRKRREDERDARKRQKQGEVDEKKKARAEERMSRLNIQVDERLFKEACFQREKVILMFAKSLGKEFSSRRKAAELVATQAIIDGRGRRKNSSSVALELPPLARVYDEDVLRVWDFFTTFGSMFLERGYLPSIPTLDSLQDAIDTLRDEKGTQKARSEANDQLVQIAIALCNPLGATLTRYLFASLIALNPVLQKDFGAAFFNEVNAFASAKDDSDHSSPNNVLPVNTLTWQEIARLTFLSDSLAEVGYSRQESAHLLRGYRSGGHPNSKESKRLRKSEDFPIATLRQELSQREFCESPENGSDDYKIRLNVPCRPSVHPKDWMFYLHNVKTLPSDSLNLVTKNVRKAISSLQSTDPETADIKTVLSDLRRGLAMLESVKESSPTDVETLRKARHIFICVLDRASGDVHSVGQVEHKENTFIKSASKSSSGDMASVTISSNRQRMGLLSTLALTDKEHKKYVHAREEYMAEALRLKEELNQEVEEDDDDDDDDDEDDVPEEKRKEKAAKKLSEESKENGSVSSDRQTSDKTDGKTEEIMSTEIIAAVVENGEGVADSETSLVAGKVHKSTPLDEFCADIPGAPEPIRRCLAVLRTLCQTGSAEPFLYPVDPQSNPGYYEIILRPMCFREVGLRLRDAATLYVRRSPAAGVVDGNDVQQEVVASIVAQFARNVRLIAQNSACYANAGAMVVSSGEEMIRIFERLLLDWVLAPKDLRPPLAFLDDDRCVEHHPSDEDSLVLLCDGCEGKYNMSRLDPPLLEVPKGDWYCPRCVSGRCWEDVDPRIGKNVKAKSPGAGAEHSKVRNGIIRRCVLGRPEGHNAKSTLLYEVEFESGMMETWTLSQVDKALNESGQSVEPVSCVEAVAESPGYGFGIDRGVFNDLVPVPLNPRVSDTAGEAAVSSSVYRDTIAGSSALRLVSPEEMTASEWMRLLVLLITKCSASELMKTFVSKMETESAEKMARTLANNNKVKEIFEVLPDISDDEQTIEVVEVERQGFAGVGNEGRAGSISLLSRSASSRQSAIAETAKEADSSAMVVEASAIEVVTENGTDTVVATSKQGAKHDESLLQTETEKAKRSAAFSEAEKRTKAREDSIAAFCIRNELRPTVASFEEDVVSQVVDSTLVTMEQGLDLGCTRCRGMVCDLCHVSDVALGSPLVRAPNNEEWDELMTHAARSRRTSLLAELPYKKKLAVVKIRVAGELVSEKADHSLYDGTPDGGMTQFLPRNEKGFQHELKFRGKVGLPFVTGSLSAHECCAIAAHRTRKECVVNEHAEKEAYLIEWNAGMECGRTLSLGRDTAGRSYWKFKADRSLFVCANESIMNGNMSPRKLWYKFSEPEEIASLLYFLADDGILADLKRAFPAASRMLRTRKWTELLLRRRFPLKSSLSVARTDASSATGSPISGMGPPEMTKEDESVSDDQAPYEENENVLVESSCGRLLWNAKIVGVSQEKSSKKVNGYRVHYVQWSSRFDEWVDPFRVVEPVENNIEIQAEMFEEARSSRDGIPPELEGMIATKFLHAKDRSRGFVALPNFSEVAQVESKASSGERAFAMLKAALLLLEGALPIGAVDNSENGPWSPSFAAEWRSSVRKARGPASLMRCVILLENSLTSEWVETHFIHLLSCLPLGWKAINEATVGLIALRIFVLDQGIQYDVVDK